MYKLTKSEIVIGIAGAVVILIMMSANFRSFLIERNFREANRKPEDITRIAIHWTANDNEGADAEANVKYFNKTKRKASAHWVVDEDEAINCVKEKDIAFAVGKKGDPSSRWNNKCSISVEICSNFKTEEDSIKVFTNVVELCRKLHKRYPNAIFMRHYDFTGKNCPKWFVANEYQNETQAKLKFCRFLEQVGPDVANKTASFWGITIPQKPELITDNLN